MAHELAARSYLDLLMVRSTMDPAMEAHQVVVAESEEEVIFCALRILRARFKERANALVKQFAGFKVLHPLNSPDKWDELISFLGASYYRALGRHQLYGASARGLVALVVGRLSRGQILTRMTPEFAGVIALGGFQPSARRSAELPSWVKTSRRASASPGRWTRLARRCCRRASDGQPTVRSPHAADACRSSA